MTSAAIHHVCSTFQPPLSGGSFRARVARFVDQSMALRSTLKPIGLQQLAGHERGRRDRNAMSVTCTTVTGRPS